MLHLSRCLLVLALILAGATANDEKATTATTSSPGNCHEEETIDSRVRVASLRLEEVQIPLIISIFIIVVILVKIGWHHPMMHYISSIIPESLVLITIGTFIGGILVSSFYLDECNRGNPFPLRFTPTLFFIYLLPPIVFASGYFMDLKAFFENILTILVFALIGTLWNAFALGFTLFGLSKANLMSSDLNIASALLFGTISAAVDPVAVLAVFDEIHVNKLLHILVFGESLLNDGVTIVLFTVLGAFANIPFDTHFPEDEHDIGVDVVLGIVQFIVVVIASIFIGIFFGCAGVLLTRISHHVHVLEPILLITVGFVSYIMADLFAFSGIVSLIACAIIMKHYVPANIAWKSNITLKYTLKMLNIISEMIIFMYLGISLFDSDVHKWDTGLILWTLLFSIVFRPIGVVALSMLMNLGRFRKISWKQMFIMSYSGLRGAVAFSLALTRIFEAGFESLPPEEQDLRRSMLTATTVLLLFTVFVQGTTIKPLVHYMGIKLDVSKSKTLNQVIHKTCIDHVATGLEEIEGHFGFNIVKEFFLHIDVKYLRKIFERNTDAIDEQIIRKYQAIQLKETTSQVFEPSSIQPQDDEPLVRRISDTPSIASSMDESYVPALDEVLRMSFPHPHDNHFSHVLSRDDHEIQDHHLEKVKVDHLIRRRTKKHARRPRRRRTTLGIGYKSGAEDVDFGLVEQFKSDHLDTQELTSEPKGITFTAHSDDEGIKSKSTDV